MLNLNFERRIELLDVISECTKYCAISEFSTLYPNFRRYIRILDVVSGYIKRCAIFNIIFQRYIWILDVIFEISTLYPNVRNIVLYPSFRRYIRIFDFISEIHRVLLCSFFTNYCATSDFATLPPRYEQYIWTLDVISETSTLYPNLLNIALYPNFWRSIRIFDFKSKFLRSIWVLCCFTYRRGV